MTKHVLTPKEATCIGREMGIRGIVVCSDPVATGLWQVSIPGAAEAHRKMDEDEWRTFLAESGWVPMPSQKKATNKPVDRGPHIKRDIVIRNGRLSFTVTNMRHAASIPIDLHNIATHVVAAFASNDDLEYLEDLIAEVRE